MPTSETWVGGTGDWATATNWSGGSKPGTLDTAIFNSVGDAILSNVEYENIADLEMSLAAAVVDIQGELTIGGAHLNGVSNAINVTAGSLTVDGGGLIAGQFVTAASGTVHLTNQGTYQWNGGGSTQNVDMGRSANDTFQFSTQFGGTISDFFAGDFISYSGSVNSVVVGANTVTFNATNGQAYVINLTGGVYDSSNIVVIGNAIESTRVFRPIQDFNRDGLTDILWRNTNGAVALWDSNGSGGFVTHNFSNPGSIWQIAGTGDFDGDGNADILWRNTSGGVTVWDSNGSGGFNALGLGNPGTSWQIAGTGDFNADGEADILWRNTNGLVMLWDSNGSGGFDSQNFSNPGTMWQIAGTGDFNGDGLTDILWRNTNGAITVWDMNGSGGYTAHGFGNPGTSMQIAGIGDFNGDGDADILFRNTNGVVSTWDSNGSGGFTSHGFGNPGTMWQIAGAGDFNGDGAADILWRNTNGAVDIWGSNSSGGFTSQGVGNPGTSWQIQV